MICPSCDKEVRPMVTMGGYGEVEKICSSLGCGYVFERKSTAAPMGEPAPVENRTLSVPKATAATGSVNVIKLAKSRRAELRKSIRRLKKELKAAEKEEGELSRLLSAAQPKKPRKSADLRAVGS